MTSQSRFLAYAVALLVLAALVLTPIALVRGKPAPEAAAPRPASAPVAADAPGEGAESEPAADSESAAVAAQKDELRAEYDKQKEKLPDEVAQPIEQDVGVIEGAAADLLAAIAHEPDNQNLKMMLIETYRNEMKLLKKALHLSSSEDAE
jgi:hypothetical protein